MTYPSLTAHSPLARFSGLATFCVCLFLTGCDPAVPEDPLPPNPDLKVKVEMLVTGIRNGDGNLIALLCKRGEGFPNDCAMRKVLPVDDSGVLSIQYADVEAGVYAFACFHDENENRFIDLSRGFPTEGLGFSRDAIGMSGPPSFSNSAFEAFADTRQTLKLRYLNAPPET